MSNAILVLNTGWPSIMREDVVKPPVLAVNQPAGQA